MQLKALIVEDDPILQILHQKILTTLSIDSVIASTGDEAIEALKNLQLDFILMDVNMPVQDGLDASRWIRDEKDLKNRDILIFALTSFTTPEHTKEILEAGMNEHLKKPLDSEELKKLLTKYFWSKNPPQQDT
ncbi:MAG: response regulator [Cyclobacteriaceae bacterium]|jgi:CheY-like chemotaxis protein|nr:response regulator [Cyclobacteriaceae bacterium]MDH4296321.1 response regulator [Cyclobacteriaceae bacterium]MDH5249539.1 response regulator [Cyclobacteriaceae bacterium]